jgi:hypothetical protein
MPIEETLADMQLKARVNDLMEVTRRHEARLESMDTLQKLVGEIHVALLGDLKEEGIVAEHRENCKFILACKKRKDDEKKDRNDWTVWAVRGAAGAAWVVLAFKVWKIGG